MWWVIGFLALILVLIILPVFLRGGGISRRNRVDDLFDGSPTAVKAADAVLNRRLRGPGGPGAGGPGPVQF